MPASAFRGGDTATLADGTCTELCVEGAQHKPTVSCFIPVVHPHLYVRPRNICFDGRLQTTDCLFYDVQKGAVWWYRLRLRARPRVLLVPMSWCSVINENHLIVWVEVEPCISKEVVEPFSIHTPL